jgi:hypothetical protein
VNRYRVKSVFDIDEASTFDPTLQFWSWLRLSTNLLDPLDDFIRPLIRRATGPESSTSGIETHIKVLELNPTTRFEVIVGLSNKLRPVHNRAGEVAGVDEVELAPKCPFLLYVVDFEPNIRRD